MAQKALKTQAARNSAILKRTHLLALGINLTFLLLRLLFLRRNLYTYVFLSLPALFFEFWFERIGRPVYGDASTGKELRRAGEDLEAKGLTEWMWDVVYWTWGCVILVALVGDWAWWLYTVVPAYSAWLAFTTFTGVRKNMGGLMGEGGGQAGAGAQSKRQAKMEKRGGQKVQYR